MAHTLTQTLELGFVEVILKYGHVVWVSTFLDDDTSSLARRQATNIGETLLGDDNIEIMLGLVDMSTHGNNARDASGISLAGTGGRSVHDRVLC